MAITPLRSAATGVTSCERAAAQAALSAAKVEEARVRGGEAGKDGSAGGDRIPDLGVDAEQPSRHRRRHGIDFPRPRDPVVGDGDFDLAAVDPSEIHRDRRLVEEEPDEHRHGREQEDTEQDAREGELPVGHLSIPCS